jgi:soluble P-type ATPase
MPLKKCTKNGISGWKWGDQGSCYTGSGAKKKAIKQGIAIEGVDKFKSIAKNDSELNKSVAKELTTIEMMFLFGEKQND